MSYTTTFDCSSGSSSSLREASIASSGTPARDSLKSRVRSVDPNHGRCLIENVPEHCVVDWAHCFPKRKAGRESLMTSLEYFWDMPRGSLNLDTRYNVFPVRPHLRQFYEKPRASGSWILIPEEHIINQYHAQLLCEGSTCCVSRNKPFPIIENGIFSYRLLCIENHKSVLDIVITRHGAPGDDSQIPSKTSSHTIHVHPFDTLPIVKSHVHPKFAILEAGRKLTYASAFDFVASLHDKNPILLRICEIYVSWTQPCPDRQFVRARPVAQDHTGTGSESGTIDSAKFTPPPFYRRVWRHRTSKKASHSQRSLSSLRGPRKRRRCSSGLSGKTLREYTRVVGKQARDSAFIEQWLGRCQPLEDHRPWEDPGYERSVNSLIEA